MLNFFDGNDQKRAFNQNLDKSLKSLDNQVELNQFSSPSLPSSALLRLCRPEDEAVLKAFSEFRRLLFVDRTYLCLKDFKLINEFMVELIDSTR